MTARRTQGDFDSVPFFRRAIELDGNFALAHARLGTVLANLAQRPEAEKAATRAFELRDRVSERERLYIEARYHTTVSRDIAKAMESYRLLLGTYADDYAAHANLGTLYRETGNLKDAIRHFEEAVRLAPGQPIGRSNLGSAYLAEGRFADARREFEETLKLQESLSARSGLFALSALTGDRALGEAQISAVRGNRDEAQFVALRAQAAAFKGQMREADRLTDEFFRGMQAANRLAFLGENLVVMAISQAAVGRSDAARAALARIERHDMISDGTTDEMVALGAVLGDARLAKAYVERAVQHVRKVSMPDKADRNENSVRALEALAAGRNQESYDLAVSAGNDFADHNAVFVAGLAALRLQRWDDAVNHFTTVLDNHSKLGLSPLISISHIMKGRALASAGRGADARKSYEEAFRIWKDADADMPLLLEARKEYAALGAS